MKKSILAFISLFVILGILSWVFLRPAVADFKRDIALRNETQALTDISKNTLDQIEHLADWYWDKGKSFRLSKEQMRYNEFLLKSEIRYLLECKPLESHDILMIRPMLRDLIDLNFSLIHFKRELERVYDYDRYREKFDEKEVATEIREYLEKAENNLREMTNLTWQAADALAVTWRDGETWGTRKTSNKEKGCEIIEEYLTEYLWIVVGQLNDALTLMKRSLGK